MMMSLKVQPSLNIIDILYNDILTFNLILLLWHLQTSWIPLNSNTGFSAHWIFACVLRIVNICFLSNYLLRHIITFTTQNMNLSYLIYLSFPLYGMYAGCGSVRQHDERNLRPSWRAVQSKHGTVCLTKEDSSGTIVVALIMITAAGFFVHQLVPHSF